MSRRTGRFWDAVAGRRQIPRVAASLGWGFVNAGPTRGRIQGGLDHVFYPLFTVPPAVAGGTAAVGGIGMRATSRPAPCAACDHGAPVGWLGQSTHRTSEGTVTYVRCLCGAWLVLLDGQRLAAVGPARPAPPVPGERSHGRGRWWLWLWLWDHGQALWKWTWRQRQRERSDPR
jgi:hypothetical protein